MKQHSKVSVSDGTYCMCVTNLDERENTGNILLIKYREARRYDSSDHCKVGYRSIVFVC